jgi:regulator of sigma E protease
MTLITLLIFAIILTVVVFIHEMGHFLAARYFGVLVEEFGIGMPPRLAGLQWYRGVRHVLRGHKKPPSHTDTVFSFNWLPLGGFVRLYGDGAGGEGGHIDPTLRHRALGSASVWGRFVIMIAGVVMNVLLAVVIYYGLLVTHGYQSDRLPLILDATFPFGKMITTIGTMQVAPGSPAEAAGIPTQALFLRVRQATCPDGIICKKEDIAWDTISEPNDLIEHVQSHGARPIELELQSNFLNPETHRVFVTPRYDEKLKRHIIGVSLFRFVTLDYSTSLSDKLFAGPMHAWNLLQYNYLTQKHIFGRALQERNARIAGEAMGGPVAIASVVHDTIQKSGTDTIRNLLSLTALISLSLAFMNILPFPALDGGRIMLLIPEAITGKKIHHKVENYINIAGFALLIVLSIAVTFQDIFRLIR